MSKLVAFLAAGAWQLGLVRHLGGWLLVPVVTACIVGCVISWLISIDVLSKRCRPFVAAMAIQAAWVSWYLVFLGVLENQIKAMPQTAQDGYLLALLINGGAFLWLAYHPGIASSMFFVVVQTAHFAGSLELWASVVPQTPVAYVIFVEMLLRAAAIVLAIAGCGFYLCQEQQEEEAAGARADARPEKAADGEVETSPAAVVLYTLMIVVPVAYRIWPQEPPRAPGGTSEGAVQAPGTGTNEPSSNAGANGLRSRRDDAGRPLPDQYFCGGVLLQDDDPRAVAMKALNRAVIRGKMPDQQRRILSAMVCQHGVDAVTRLYPGLLQDVDIRAAQALSASITLLDVEELRSGSIATFRTAEGAAENGVTVGAKLPGTSMVVREISLSPKAVLLADDTGAQYIARPGRPLASFEGTLGPGRAVAPVEKPLAGAKDEEPAFEK